MNTPKRSNSKEKASARSRSPASSLSLPTPPDSMKEPSTSPSLSPSPAHSAEERSTLPSTLESLSLASLPHSPGERLTSPLQSLSSSGQRAFDIFKSIKQGRGPSESPWLKLRLEPSDYPLLEEKLKVEDVWGYVEDKIRFDYDSQTCILIFRMPTTLHELFTNRVADEIKLQLRGLREDRSKSNVSISANSIECCASGDIELLGYYSKRSPDSSFQHLGAKFPSLIIETSYSQKRKDLPRLADDYILGSHANIKMMIGLDIEYRKSKRATVSVWEYEKGIEEDGVPYIGVKKIVDDKPFRNDDLSDVAEDALVIPLSIFALDKTPLDAEISISYATLKSCLKKAEDMYQGIKTSGSWEQAPPEVRLRKRQRTPEEQLKDEDEANFVASEKEAEKKANEEDGTWTPKKNRR